MTPQQRREYIAEKILGWKRDPRYGWKSFDGSRWQYHVGLPDFESLPEWTGPICEVVLPLFAEHGISIHFHQSQEGNKPMFFFDDGTTDPMISLDRYQGPFYLEEFIKRIVDAHIKITGEKGE